MTADFAIMLTCDIQKYLRGSSSILSEKGMYFFEILNEIRKEEKGEKTRIEFLSSLGCCELINCFVIYKELIRMLLGSSGVSLRFCGCSGVSSFLK